MALSCVGLGNKAIEALLASGAVMAIYCYVIEIP
jgi:hypothetical protein